MRGSSLFHFSLCLVSGWHHALDVQRRPLFWEYTLASLHNKSLFIISATVTFYPSPLVRADVIRYYEGMRPTDPNALPHIPFSFTIYQVH